MEFSKAEQVIVLPTKKGGTNANTASQAATNILGSNFANYSEILPLEKGGTGATTNLGAQYNLGLNPVYKANSGTGKSMYIKIATVKLGDKENCTNQIVQIAGMSDWGTLPFTYLLYISGNNNLNTIPAKIYTLNTDTIYELPHIFSIGYIDRTVSNINYRDIYFLTGSWNNITYFQFLINNPENSQFTTYYSNTEPAGLSPIPLENSAYVSNRKQAKLIWK
ncbi:MAG: hypothetical protein LBT85_01375 [Bifidobacteriaceae bacterium]|nr:hypothetical protein [Bifidobacteriaceae bacterium]